MSRARFIIYKRSGSKKIGAKEVYTVGIWSDEEQKYIRRATESTSRAGAQEIALQWIKDGLPSTGVPMLHEYLKNFWKDDSEWATRRAGDRKDRKPLSKNYIEMGRLWSVYISEVLKNKPIDRIKPQDINTLKKQAMDDGKSDNTVNIIIKTLKIAVNDWYLQQGTPEKSPSRMVRNIQIGKIPRKLMEVDELIRFFNAPCLTRDRRLLYMLAIQSGLRIGECLGLKIDDLELREAGGFKYYKVYVRRQYDDEAPKTGEGEASISYKLGKEIHDFYEADTWRRGWIFQGRDKDRPRSYGATAETLGRDICTALGITDKERQKRKLSFHSWRHLLVTYLKHEAGAGAAMAGARHSSENMTELYNDPTEGMIADNAKTMSAVFDDLKIETRKAIDQPPTT